MNKVKCGNHNKSEKHIKPLNYRYIKVCDYWSNAEISYDQNEILTVVEKCEAAMECCVWLTTTVLMLSVISDHPAALDQADKGLYLF